MISVALQYRTKSLTRQRKLFETETSMRKTDRRTGEIKKVIGTVFPGKKVSHEYENFSSQPKFYIVKKIRRMLKEVCVFHL